MIIIYVDIACTATVDV